MSKVEMYNKRNKDFFHYLTWESPPEYVLVIKDDCNTELASFIEIVNYLIYDHGITVYIEEKDYIDKQFIENENIQNAIKCIESSDDSSNLVNKLAAARLRLFVQKNLNVQFQSSPVPVYNNYEDLKYNEDETETVFNNDNTEETKIDFVICLGGDGTLLHASTIFQESCPPVISIHSGHLGFLCPFSFSNYKEYLGFIIKGDVPLLFRNRLRCKIRAKLTNSLSNGLLEEVSHSSDYSDFQSIASLENQQESRMISLNEVVIGRGPSSFICNLELYVNDYLITTIQGDGVIISTPTGSTAYAMAAGASMSHPSLPAIIITPICPHSLSFRPIVVPAGVKLTIQLSSQTRNTAWYSVDGSTNKELLPGYSLLITTSKHPLPSICRSDQINDWFEGLATCLNWNKRKQQLPLNSCYLNMSQDYNKSNDENKQAN